MQRKPMGIKALFFLFFILSLINIATIDSLAAVRTCTVDWRDEDKQTLVDPGLFIKPPI